jgi:hypothetical protein
MRFFLQATDGRFTLHRMINQKDFPDIPVELLGAPWLERMISSFQGVIQEQARIIEEQKQLIQRQAERIAVLEDKVSALQDEIIRLKNLPKRPKFRSGRGSSSGNGSGCDSGAARVQRSAPSKKQEEIVVRAENVPEGSRFKGYQTYTIQEIELVPKDVTYKLEVWQTANGSVIRAVLPSTIVGSHFGPSLRALVHNLYANGMTQPAIFDFLMGAGIELSEGQIHNILMEQTEHYHQQSEAILSAGLQEAPYIRVDDTGASHEHKAAYCTHVGGEYFAYYKTTSSKSRINFLEILLQGKEGYIVNEAFIWHLFQCGVEDDILNAFEGRRGKCYRTRKGLHRLLNELGLGNKKLRLCCVEAGLIGFIQEKLLHPGQVLISDRAGQFLIFDHSECWIHMERPLRKLEAKTAEVEEEIRRVREAIWTLYDKVKEASIAQVGKEEVFRLYDQLVAMKVTSPGVQDVINNFRSYRDGLLKALDHPGLPLHNNDSERDIRGMVKFRKVSGSTKSHIGKTFRDALMTLKQTCFRLGRSFLEYLTRLFQGAPLDLAQCVREQYRMLSRSPPQEASVST